jgi:glycosidase
MNKYLLFFGLLIFASCSKKGGSNNSASNDPAVVPQYGTPFANVPATTADVSLYEVNERGYSATGDFNGVTARLDAIHNLGINTIWLMPINPIGKSIPGHGSVNSPYCVQDHLGLNPEFGTIDDLRNLIDMAHSKNMAVILDWAANQTSWDNAWITEHKDWYAQDGNGNIVYPSTFTDVAQLNFQNYDMRAQMIKDMKYWIHEANFDGFRCDYADNIPDDFWSQAIDSLNNIQPGRKLILLAEGGSSNHLQAGFQMVFGEQFYSSLLSTFSTSTNGAPADIYAANVNEYTNSPGIVPAGKERLRFTTTHDHDAFTGPQNGTPLALYNGKAGALAASVIAINMPGVPMIYGSQEVGRPDAVPFFSQSTTDWTQNPDMVAAYTSMLTFRNSSEAVKTGALTTYPDADVVCFKRAVAADSVIVIVNVRNAGTVFTLPAAIQNTNWTNAYNNTSVSLTTSLTLSAYQYYVLKSN